MPVVVLTKSDLCDDLDYKLSEVSSIAFGLDILVTTSTEENGYRELLPFISEGKTIAFIVLPAWENLLLSIFYWVKSS